MNKFEKLIKLIVNEDEAQAKKLFHNIVVEQSRTIYESMIDEADLEEESVEEMEDEVEADETLESVINVEEAKQLLDHIDGTLAEGADDLLQRVAEHFDVDVAGLVPVLESHGDALLEMAYGVQEDDDEEFGDEGEEEFSGDMEDGGDYAGDEMGDEGEMDMADDAELEDRVVDIEDAIDELKAEFDALIGDEGMGDEMGDMEMDDTEDMAMDVADDEYAEESLVREYVEKVSTPSNSEAEGTNKGSTVAGKNDMGGTTANILGDQSEEKGGSNPSVKPGQTYQNDPKAKAGKTSFKKKEKATNKTDSEKSILDGPKGK